MKRYLVIPALLGFGTLIAGCTVSGFNNGSTTPAVFTGQATSPQQTAALQQDAPPLTSAQNASRKSGIKIAMLLPLSARGRAASIAKSMKQAGELALFDFNKDNIVLLTRDTKGTPEGAKKAAQDAIESGAEIVLGPLFSRSVSAAAPLLRSAGIPAIAFSSDMSTGGDGIYLQSFLPGHGIERIVSYTIAQGRSRFAAIVPTTPTGQIVESRFRNAVSKYGGQIVTLERSQPDPNKMLPAMERIAKYASSKDGNIPSVDALFMPFGPKLLPSVSPLIPYVEIDTKKVKVIGTGRWNYSGIGKEKALHGGWYPAPDPAKWRRFARKYAQTYGAQPARIASLAFDAVSLSIALSGATPGQRYTAAYLTRQSGFSGVDGLFRLKPNGHTERGLAVLQVQKFGTKIVDVAPSSFGTASYPNTRPNTRQVSNYQN